MRFLFLGCVAASLALNVFLATAFVTQKTIPQQKPAQAETSKKHKGVKGKGHLSLRGFVRGIRILPKESKEIGRAHIDERLPVIREQGQITREALVALQEALVAVPFSPENIQEAQGAYVAAAEKRERLVVELVASSMALLSDEERILLAEKMTEPRRGKPKGDKEKRRAKEE